jgi:GH15 family glucan-1,4-alpha-glucosidase
MPLVRFLPADDKRVVATINAIADELTDDSLVLRYRVEETDDSLGGRRARSVCSFWLVSALARSARRAAPRAVQSCCHTRRRCCCAEKSARHLLPPQQPAAFTISPDQRSHAWSADRVLARRPARSTRAAET